jgi:hypothetical protein
MLAAQQGAPGCIGSSAQWRDKTQTGNDRTSRHTADTTVPGVVAANTSARYLSLSQMQINLLAKECSSAEKTSRKNSRESGNAVREAHWPSPGFKALLAEI